MTGSISRRRLIVGAGATGMLVAANSGPARAVATGQRPSATATVIVNGKVYTGVKQGQGPLEAVAIAADGRIQEVGSTQQIRRLIGRGTEVIDAQGCTIMSGIHDGHMH